VTCCSNRPSRVLDACGVQKLSIDAFCRVLGPPHRQQASLTRPESRNIATMLKQVVDEEQEHQRLSRDGGASNKAPPPKRQSPLLPASALIAHPHAVLCRYLHHPLQLDYLSGLLLDL
jgi:hypothetical protein